MKTIYAIHAPYEDRLPHVIAKMKELGAPTIEVVDCGDYYMALGGSHRLAAASALGLKPALVVHDQEDEIDITKFDWVDDAGMRNAFTETNYLAGEIAGELFSPYSAVDYNFDD